MGELALTGSEISRKMSISPEHIAIGHQAIESHGASRWQSLRTDADLSAKAIAEAIGKTTGTVVINPGTVHGRNKTRRRSLILRDDDLGMTRPLLADVVHRFIDRIDHPNRED